MQGTLYCYYIVLLIEGVSLLLSKIDATILQFHIFKVYNYFLFPL